MYLLQVGTNGISLLSLIVVAVTTFAINYWLIKTAIRDALRYPLESLIAYKLIELKKAGVSYKGLEEAAKYILVHQISRRSAVTKKLKDQTEEWWNSVEKARQEG